MSRVQCNRFVLDEEGLLGPSPRFVIWFHGWYRNCPGCIGVDWNTKRKPEFDLSVLTIVQTIEKYPLAEGITISGGEPFCQVDALLELASALYNNGLGIIIYTGYELSELIAMHDDRVDRILSIVDVLIDGRYISELDDDKPFRGSANQTIHQFSDRYAAFFSQEKERTASIEKQAGQELLTGIPDSMTKLEWAKIKETHGKKC